MAEIIQRRCSADIGAAADIHPQSCTTGNGHRQRCRQHQRDAAGGADSEIEAAATQRARPEKDFLGFGFQPLHFCATKRRHGLDGSKMLRCQTGVGAFSADIVQMDGLPGNRRQRHRRTQQLPPPSP